MMNDIIDAATANLKRAATLIPMLEAESYSNSNIGPYYSSIGEHLRHVLDIFKCLVDGLDSKVVDLSDRVRGTEAETIPERGLQYLNAVIKDLARLRDIDQATPITVIDDLGLGTVDVPSTLGAVLCQAHSHAIHHFASIGYLLHLQGLPLPDCKFGYNPTTPISTQR